MDTWKAMRDQFQLADGLTYLNHAAVSPLPLMVNVVQPLLQGRQRALRAEGFQLAHYEVVGEGVAADEYLADDADARLGVAPVNLYRGEGVPRLAGK